MKVVLSIHRSPAAAAWADFTAAAAAWTELCSQAAGARAEPVNTILLLVLVLVLLLVLVLVLVLVPLEQAEQIDRGGSGLSGE